MSQGPLMKFWSAMVCTCWPRLLTTSSEPLPAVAQVPSVEGKLPTITKPSCNTPRAVDKPGCEGDEVKKTESGPCLGTRTMVVPVPCRLWTLLKFETKMSPGLITPPGKPGGTKATPYGLTSPFDGIV